MILDTNLIFCEDKTIATGVTNTVDISAGGDALGNELTVVGTIPAAAAGGTKLVVAMETSDDSGFSSTKTLYTSPDILTAQMTGGAKVLAFRMPRCAKRYLRCRLTATGTFTAGTISLFMVTGDQHSFKEIGK